MLQDLRHGVRVLLQSKGWTAVIVLSLALGIGASTALFSGINGLVFKPLPVKDPSSLVRLRYAGKNEMGNDFSDYGYSEKTADGQNVRSTFPYAIYLDFLKNNQTMSDLAAGAPKGNVNVVVDGEADIARAYVASGNFYQLLGIPAILGRPLLPEDDNLSASPVAVISEGYWKRRFGGNAGAIGKVVQVNNTPVTIVGVTSESFIGIQQAFGNPADITLPLAVDPKLDNSQELTSATWWWLQIMGRLKSGMTPAQVRANLDGVLQDRAQAGWDGYLATLSDEERSTAKIRSRHEVPHLLVDSGARGIYDLRDSDRSSMILLSVVVAVVLLIVCANVANLLLTRAASRQKEISVRLSMGATRGRLIRQFLTESLLLAFTGGAAGLLVGYWARHLLPEGADQIPFDWRLFSFIAALTLLTGMAFGIAPAVRATGINVNATLKESGRSVIGSRTILSRALLVFQVGLSLVLLIGAGLFLTTLKNLHRVNVGFNTENLLMFRVNPQLNRYDQTRTAMVYAQLIETLQSVPGVRSVSLSQPALLSGSVSSTGIFIEGHSYSSPQGDDINQVRISSSFFQTLGIPLVAGRFFTDRDDDKSPKVAIINQAAARKYFSRENPVGRHFGKDPEESRRFEVVGVVGDTKYNSLREDAPPTVYFSYRQQCCPAMTFELRTATDPSPLSKSIRDAVRQIDPNLPLTNLTTQAEQIEARLQQERLFAQSYAMFGGLALLLASIGLFGLMSYNVARRTNEIGVRMALGAQRQQVLRLIMKEAMILVAIGITTGLITAVAAGRFVQSQLFGLTSADPAAIGIAVIMLAAVSLLAGYLPARKASLVDPLVALHYE